MDNQYNYQESQQRNRELWEQHKVYSCEDSSKPVYSIDTPPPTVSGSLHIGHVFSYTQTDIVARYKRMLGYSIFYPFGFDNNGLPTERFVEKKRAIRGHMMPRSEFIKLCLEEAFQAEKGFVHLWKQLAISANWNNTYSTISDSVRKLSQESFINLYERGFVYRRCEPALYCVVCRTSVAQAELEDKESSTMFNTIVFKDAQNSEVLIATTRPELLSSCVAVLYNPADERYLHLQGSSLQVPIFNFSVPVLPDEQVSIEKGTGLVMVCTFGDKTDIEWYKKYNFAYKQSIGNNGLFVQNTGLLAGLTVSKARERIIEALKDADLLRDQKVVNHTVGVHERCKNEIEYLVLQQWFVSVVKHKEKLLEISEKITWHPAFMKARYRDWVENLKWDWCISRQRFFGIPFPVWHCQSCGHVICAKAKDLPLDPQETAYQGTCPQCTSDQIIPDTDVMDTWNTSSITPYICYSLLNPHDEDIFTDPQSAVTKFLPMGMRPQAHDIIRTWAFYTIIKCWMHHDQIAWNDIVISGHVLSDKNKKLSKSQGTDKAITPENLLANFPADAIRYWTASAKLGQDTAFSEEQIRIGSRLITKLWNAFKFLQSHMVDHAENSPKTDSFGVINEWILHRSTQVFAHYTLSFDQFESGVALEHVERFFWHDFCDNYIEIVKHQLFNPALYEPEEIRVTQWTLYTVGLRILQLYAPFIPDITEQLYQLIYKQRLNTVSVHATQYGLIQTEFHFPESLEQMDTVIAVVGHVRKLKSLHHVSLKTAVAVLHVIGTQKACDIIVKSEQYIKGVTQAESVVYHYNEPCKTELIVNGERHEAWVTV